jgi:peptidoglycan/LPS O-acetylase OafA/YrhL
MQNNFHLIRFIAASLVLFGHCYPMTDRGTYDYITIASTGIFPTAHMGVCIFFIVSGYLISQSLQNSKTLINFFWRRFLRIYPALIIALLFCIFVVGPICTVLPLKSYFTSYETYRFFKWLKLYPFIYNTLPGVFQSLPEKDNINGSLWTLPYEITMYLSLMILGYFNLFKKRFFVLFIYILSFPIVYYALFYVNISKLIPILHLSLVSTLEFGSFFFAGVILFLFKDKVVYKFIYFVFMIIVWFGFGFWDLTRNDHFIKIISLIALPYMVMYLANLKGKLNRFGEIGDFSYGIYIYAFPVQQMLVYSYGTEISIIKLFLMSFSITLTLSIFSWYLIEEKALRLKSLIA